MHLHKPLKTRRFGIIVEIDHPAFRLKGGTPRRRRIVLRLEWSHSFKNLSFLRFDPVSFRLLPDAEPTAGYRLVERLVSGGCAEV